MLLGEKYTHKADLWSYGVVMWEVCREHTPASGRTSLSAPLAPPRLEGFTTAPPPPQILTAKIPFDGMDRAELARKVALDGMRLPPPPGVPLPLLRVMASLWLRPAKRPEFSKVVATLREVAAELVV